MYAGTTPTLKLYNLWDGFAGPDESPNCTPNNNGYCGLDRTNMHTHGLHVSPFEDNVEDKVIDPGTSLEYTYTLPFDHYPGIHWYHAHHHGSTALHVEMGIFGAILIENNDQIYDLQDYEYNILEFSWLFLPNDCNCNTFENDASAKYSSCTNPPKGCFWIHSLCYQYCSYHITQRAVSTYNNYNNFVTKFTSSETQFFLVNGQQSPDIGDITINKFRRLMFVNAISEYYIVYKLPITNCFWYLLGYDGVFFTTDTGQTPNRYLNDAPFNGQFMLPPGGRADLLVKCNQISFVLYTLYK